MSLQAPGYYGYHSTRALHFVTLVSWDFPQKWSQLRVQFCGRRLTKLKALQSRKCHDIFFKVMSWVGELG